MNPSRIHPDRIRKHLRDRHPVRADVERLPAAAVSLVIAGAGHDPLRLLFIRRAARRGDPWSGQMALPGGRRGPEDPSLLDTAVRETFEETAILLPRDACVGELDDLAPQIPVLPPVAVRPFVFHLSTPPPVTLNHEADLYLWIPLHDLYRSRGRAAVTARNRVREVDAFVVGEHVIWGMTHRIVAPFLEAVIEP